MPKDILDILDILDEKLIRKSLPPDIAIIQPIKKTVEEMDGLGPYQGYTVSSITYTIGTKGEVNIFPALVNVVRNNKMVQINLIVYKV